MPYWKKHERLVTHLQLRISAVADITLVYHLKLQFIAVFISVWFSTKFSTWNRVRIAAVQQILPHLSSTDEAQTARPDLDQAVISMLPNLYCLRNPLDISLDTSNKSILKVWISRVTGMYVHILAYRGVCYSSKNLMIWYISQYRGNDMM